MAELNTAAAADPCAPPGKRQRTLLSNHPLFSVPLSASPEGLVDLAGKGVFPDARRVILRLNYIETSNPACCNRKDVANHITGEGTFTHAEYEAFDECDIHCKDDPQGGEIELLDLQQHVHCIITNKDLCQEQSSCSAEAERNLSETSDNALIVVGNLEQDSRKCHNEWPGLPIGVKLNFDPSDEELLWHLHAKLGKREAKPHPLISEFIISLDEDDRFGYIHPQRLPGVKQDGSVSYFFHRRFKVFNLGNRKHQKMRNADFGVVSWHKIGTTKPVIVDGIHQGCKKIMVLYVTMKEGDPEKTNWMMHQYHLGSGELGEGEFVASKIFYQQNSRHSVKKAQDRISMEVPTQGIASTPGNNVGSVMDYSSEFTTDEEKAPIHSEFSTDEIFKSREELIKWVRDRGRMNGFVILIKKSEIGRKGRKPRLWFGCERGGKYRNHRRGAGKNKEETETGSRISKKCECPFSLWGRKLDSDDDWMLDVDCGEHNHPTTEQVKHTFAGRLTDEESVLVDEMFRQSVRPKDILTVLKQRDPYNAASIRTIYNAFHKYKLSQKAAGSQIQQQAHECISNHASPEALSNAPYESKTLWSFSL